MKSNKISTVTKSFLQRINNSLRNAPRLVDTQRLSLVEKPLSRLEFRKHLSSYTGKIDLIKVMSHISTDNLIAHNHAKPELFPCLHDNIVDMRNFELLIDNKKDKEILLAHLLSAGNVTVITADPIDFGLLVEMHSINIGATPKFFKNLRDVVFNIDFLADDEYYEEFITWLDNREDSPYFYAWDILLTGEDGVSRTALTETFCTKFESCAKLAEDDELSRSFAEASGYLTTLSELKHRRLRNGM